MIQKLNLSPTWNPSCISPRSPFISFEFSLPEVVFSTDGDSGDVILVQFSDRVETEATLIIGEVVWLRKISDGINISCSLLENKTSDENIKQKIGIAVGTNHYTVNIKNPLAWI